MSSPGWMTDSFCKEYRITSTQTSVEQILLSNDSFKNWADSEQKSLAADNTSNWVGMSLQSDENRQWTSLILVGTVTDAVTRRRDRIKR